MAQNIPEDWNLSIAQRNFILELLRRIAELEQRVTELEEAP